MDVDCVFFQFVLNNVGVTFLSLLSFRFLQGSSIVSLHTSSVCIAHTDKWNIKALLDEIPDEEAA